ncbi:heat-inducible transcriptional repressor HrcA [Gloeocapsa sp. PCC 73106]|uniref:heat-inducible transcriptional repressor HrcA n=1 Tax=Gloeocapsa sp. PCC 73106 TaxID=102232 RepID=UPI0002ACC86F|nr:heat-inducible transcriptional repressor HrcA [Gloeocapsa sp. PCC 73106]ELR97959.1 heat-inducible transcription repressor HrcA [Gloeocapsa sp. PCC 73106]
MSVQHNLTERHQNILRATIKHYIATAEPVGSKTLIEEYDFSVSSATIRNIMGRLEKAGLLYQPHTSAGRIPSDEGYRIYVDQLITRDQHLGKKIEQSLKQELHHDTWSFESLIQKAAKFLASVSGYIALVTIPQTSTNQLRHVQLLLTESQQIILIIVTDAYQTQSFLIDSGSESFSDNELQILSNFLNHKLKGKYISELTSLDWSDLDQEFQRYTDFLTKLFANLRRQSQLPRFYPMLVHGIAELLRQPEFAQPEATQILLHLLEEQQEKIWPLIFELSTVSRPTSKATIRIGAENDLESMRNCSVVSSLYCQGNLPVGSVAIIGPTRMLYENAIPLVESAAAYLSEALTS